MSGNFIEHVACGFNAFLPVQSFFLIRNRSRVILSGQVEYIIPMLLDFLPKKIYDPLSVLGVNYVYEIRIRLGFSVKINYKGEFYFLTETGECVKEKSGRVDLVVADGQEISEIIDKVTQRSIYAFNDRIKSGFITGESGERIGLAGDCVVENGKIITIKNLTSLNVRVPHSIENCSDKLFPFICCGSDVKNTVIVSPPFCGKTTILKDLAKKLNDKNAGSIMIIDERGEFADVKGENIDKISFSDKEYAFSFGLRALSPDIVITDELFGEKDWRFCSEAVSCGIKIIASVHAGNIDELKSKNYFVKNVFFRYVVLDGTGLGKIKRIYDEDFKAI